MPPLQRQVDDDFLSDSEHSQIDASAPMEGSSTEALHKQQSAARRSVVTFGSIQVREYNRIVGDHPDVKVGPPISIGWDFVEHDALPLEDYESTRTRRFVRRLSSITRKNMLEHVFGIPAEEIAAAERENQKIRQRTTNSSSSSSLSKVSSKTASVRRKLKRVMLGRTLMQGLAAAAGAMMVVPPLGGSHSSSSGMGVY